MNIVLIRFFQRIDMDFSLKISIIIKGFGYIKLKIVFSKKFLDDEGIEPSASRMRSARSTPELDARCAVWEV